MGDSMKEVNKLKWKDAIDAFPSVQCATHVNSTKSFYFNRKCAHAYTREHMLYSHQCGRARLSN